jgi:formylglycine-generating enzyme required for sulfatase activity
MRYKGYPRQILVGRLILLLMTLVFSLSLFGCADPIFISPTLGAKFALIPSGSFMMGSPNDERGRAADETQHEVRITPSFYMQTTEVTQGQWKKVMGNNPSTFKNCGDDCPVEQVFWNDVLDFIEKLNRMEKTTNYGLPTEAQWEYAARAETETRYNTGNNEEDLARAGWYAGNSGAKTHPVAQKEPNAWGLYDMHGNVWEWVQDRYGEYLPGYAKNPEGPSNGSLRIFRGGSWYDFAPFCRSALRYNYDGGPGNRGDGLGFRLIYKR